MEIYKSIATMYLSNQITGNLIPPASEFQVAMPTTLILYKSNLDYYIGWNYKWQAIIPQLISVVNIITI